MSTIQWYPGHMAKTRRQMAEDIRLVDVVCEILDARIPVSSRNPDLDGILGNKPRLILLNRTDLADSSATKQWMAYLRGQGLSVLATDCKSGKGVKQIPDRIAELLSEKREQEKKRGRVGGRARVMVVGIPNVGKSTLINQISGKKRTRVENRPGVTRGKQWVSISPTLELLDTPGILWPKFEDQQVGFHLACTGAIKENILDTEEVAASLMEVLAAGYPDTLKTRYKMELPENAKGYRLLELAAEKRGMRISGGELDTERMSRVLLEEFRNGKLGRLTLEMPGWGETDGEEKRSD